MTKPKVQLINYTPLWVCSNSIRKCWDSGDKSDTTILSDGDFTVSCTKGFEGYYTNPIDANGKPDSIGPKDRDLIDRVGNKNRHSSTLEHLVYNFDISNISRACLQELARHRIASYSVKSTRYTLKELKDELPFTEYTDLNHQDYLNDGRERAEKYLVMTEDERVNRMGILALDNLRDLLNENISNDIVKYALPESYKTELSWTINARSLQNFLSLRTSKSALWEIRNLALEVHNQLPEDHKYLFEGIV